jgi:hypothetical protein
VKISNPRFLCTENPQPQIELLSLILLEYICRKILAWFLSVFGVLHDSCNFTFAMRWVFWKVNVHRDGHFAFQNTYLAVPVIPTGYHGEKKNNTRFLCLAKPSAVGFTRIKYFSPATTSDQHKSLSLSRNNLWTTQVCMSLLSYNLWPTEGCMISNWSATMAFCPEAGPQAACILCARIIVIVSSTPSLLSV